VKEKFFKMRWSWFKKQRKSMEYPYNRRAQKSSLQVLLHHLRCLSK